VDPAQNLICAVRCFTAVGQPLAQRLPVKILDVFFYGAPFTNRYFVCIFYYDTLLANSSLYHLSAQPA
jgi:hypothetical protein